MEARLADGRILKFPDGTAPDVVQSTVKRVLAQGAQDTATAKGQRGIGAPQPAAESPAAPPAFSVSNMIAPLAARDGTPNASHGASAAFNRNAGTGGSDAVTNALTGFAHGAIDVPADTLAQGATWLSDKLGLSDGLQNRVTAGVNSANKLYGQNTAGSTAARVGDIAGQIGTAIATPGAALIKGAGWLPKLARWGTSGGILGTEQSSAHPDTPLWQDLAVNTALGIGGGLLGEKVIAPAASALWQRGSRGAGVLSDYLGLSSSPAAVAADAAAPAARVAGPRVEPTLGPSPSSAPPQGGPVPVSVANPAPPVNVDATSAAAKARLARFSELGLTGDSGPTRAMLTRDPKHWQWEQNTAKSQDLGGPLTERFQNINAGLHARVDEIKSGTGGRAATPHEAGSNTLEAIQTKSDEMQTEIGKLYRGVRSTVGDQFGARPAGLLGKMDELGDIAAADPLIISVQRRLARLGIAGPNDAWQVAKGATPRVALSVNEGEELRKFIGNLPGSDPTSKMVKSNLIDSLDDDVINGAGVDSFKTARDAARAKFSEFERNTMKGLQTGQMEPDDVLRKTVLAGKVADIRSLKSSLLTGTPEQVQRGTAAWNDLRGQTADRLVTAGFGPQGAGKFSPKAFNDEMKRIGPERLAEIFTPAELSKFRNISFAGADAFGDVPFSAVNHSNSGIFAVDALRAGTASSGAKALGIANKGMGLVDAGTGIPVSMITRPLQAGLEKMGARGAVKSALNPDIDAMVSAAARRAAKGRVAELLKGLPMSHATAAAYNTAAQ